MKFEELAGYRNDVKRHLKKFRTLDEDLAVARKVLAIMPEARPLLSFAVAQPRTDVEVINMRITTKSIKGKGLNSGLRLIYIKFKAEPRIIMMGLSQTKAWVAEEKKILSRKF